MSQSYMKTQKVAPLVIKMALPMTVSMLINSLYNIIDSYFVAKISEDAMTALSLVFPVQNLVNAVTIGFAIGLNAVISFHLGAGNKDLADKATTSGFLLNLVHGAVLTVVLLAGVPAFLRFFTDSAAVLNYGINYAKVVFLFSIPFSAAMSFEKIFQATGKMTVSMISLLAGCVINIILDPIMIFGLAGFPKMGIRGAALATGIGQTASLVIYLIVYFTKGMGVRINFKDLKGCSELCKKTYSIGIPAALSLALPSLMISVLNSILAAFSQSCVLVLGAYYKLQTFLYLTANGIVQGMRPIMGYNYGAGEHKRVRDIFKFSLILIVAVMAVGTVLCAVIPSQLIGLFTENEQTINIGAHALRIICIGFIISSISVTASGALEALGKGFQSLVISLLRYTVAILPIAFLLSRAIGADGVWHAFWITEYISAVASIFLCKDIIKNKSFKINKNSK
ncbi:MAG: MATE family efflux transporter [Eubacterium sp.]